MLPDPASIPRPWEARYPPGVPASYDYPVVPLPRIMDDAARDFPAITAVEYLGARMSYRALLEQTDRFAAALSALGVARGDRVGVLLPTCPQHIVAIFAVLRLGAIVSAHDPELEPEEIALQLRDSGAKAVVLLDRLAPQLEPYRDGLPALEHWIVTSLLGALPAPRRLLVRLRNRRYGGGRGGRGRGDAWLAMQDLIAGSSPAVGQEHIDPVEDVALLVYPASTGQPARGVMLTHHNLLTNAFQVRLWMPDVQAGGESVLCVEPFHRPYGLTASLLVGVLSAATLTLVPWPKPGPVLTAITRSRPTLLALSAGRYEDLMMAPDLESRELTSIRLALSSGAPLSPHVTARFEECSGAKVRDSYGLAQASPLTHANPMYGRAKPGAIGLPLPDTVAAVFGPDERPDPTPPGTAGVLAVAGPQVMRGYWRRADDTARDLRDGWLLTGDRARMDDEGYFSLDS